MRRLCPLLVHAVALIAISPAAQALSASEVFAKTHHAIYLVIVTGDEPGVVDVVARGSAVLIAPGRFVTNCHVLERGKNFIISRREDKIIGRDYRDCRKGQIARTRGETDFSMTSQLRPIQSLQLGSRNSR